MKTSERKKIYRKAAESFFTKEQIYCCDAIAPAAKIKYHDVTDELFPEIFLFKPSKVIADR